MKKVLIFTDGKAGHENQSKALARALGCDFDIFELHFRSKFHKALSYLFDHLGVYATFLYDAWPAAGDYVAAVGTGSGTFYAAKVYAKHAKIKCAVVLYPRGYCLRSFDCILSPFFDLPKKAGNVITIPANLVANDDRFYVAGVENFKVDFLKQTGSAFAPNRAVVAVIIGGPNKCSTMTAPWMKSALDQLFRENPNCDFWVTTSRRTPSEVEAVVDTYPWQYRLLYSREKFNPIPAFVMLAKCLYVSAESTGMISEAATFGVAEVRVLDNLRPGPHKFRRFVEGLTDGGYLNGSRKVDLTNEIADAKMLLGL